MALWFLTEHAFDDATTEIALQEAIMVEVQKFMKHQDTEIEHFAECWSTAYMV